jgi:hypothetical protein
MLTNALKLRVGLIVCTWLTLAIAATAAEKRPNVVIMMADDLGSGDLGCYGGPAKTPVLDGLPARGVRFTQLYAGCPGCSPSRAVAITGRHHIRTGVYTVLSDRHHSAHLLEREITIAEVLRDNGYDTAHLGKWHLGMPYSGREKPTPDKHGFNYWFGTENMALPSHKNPTNFYRNGEPLGKIEGYACQIVADDAINWLDETRDPKAPFFCIFGSTSLICPSPRRMRSSRSTALWIAAPLSILGPSTIPTARSGGWSQNWKKWANSIIQSSSIRPTTAVSGATEISA